MSQALEQAVVSELTAGARILVSRLHYLGDVILSLPLVHALKERFPQSEIDYLTRADGADVLSGEPAIARVHRFAAAGSGLGLVHDMRRRKYAAAFDLYSNPRSAVLTWLSGARLRVGGDRRGRRMFYTHPMRVPRDVRSATAHHLYYARALGVNGAPAKPTLQIASDEKRAAHVRLEDAVVPREGPLIGIHPGGKWEVKRWPTDYFVDLARRLAVSYGARIIVFSGPGEERYRDAIGDVLKDDCVCMPVMSIRETAAVLSCLSAMVVCDGGIMHVSVAVGTPTVGIFGSSEHDVWFPYEDFGPYRAAVVPITCRPCHSHVCGHISCLRNLTVDIVERRVHEVLQ